MLTRRFIRKILLAAGLAVASTQAHAISCAIPAGADQQVAEVVAQTNALRQSRGLKPLRVSPVLTRAAQDHACAMTTSGNFSHRGAGGTTPKTRISRAGCRSRYTAENIAMGFASGSRTMGLWIDSPGHLRNLLSRGVDTIGVAVAAPRPGQGGGPRWVQTFARGC